MTDLTEQWKKGELPSGMYYIELKDGDIVKDVYAFGSWGNINEHFLKQVLAEVPSYEEYQKLLSDQLAKIEGEEINAELEAEIKEKETQRIELMMKLNDVNNENHALGIEITKLKTEYEKECHRADELEDSYWKAEKENQKLKEEVSRESYKVSEAYCLVEELKELLKKCRDEIDYLRKHYNGIIDHFKNNIILDKEINEVLK